MAEVSAPQGTLSERILFSAGWWVLVVLTALLGLNHVAGVLLFASSDDERMLFVEFAAVQAISLLILFIPYRRLEWWAWWAMWISIVAVGGPLVFFPGDPLGILYAVIAGVMALAQVATSFRFRRGRGG